MLASDVFLDHGLERNELEPLLEVLAGQSKLHAAWLVRKQLEHFPERQLFVLCLRSLPNWLGASSDYLDQKLVTALVPRLVLPGQVLTTCPQAGFKPLARKIMTRTGAQIIPAPT